MTPTTEPDPWVVAQQLADEVTARNRALHLASADSQAAIKRAGAANARLNEALVPYRQLMAALAGNAGLDKGTKLADAVAAAAAVLGDSDGEQETPRL